MTTTPLLELTALAVFALSECRLGLSDPPPSLSKVVVQQSSVAVTSHNFGNGIILHSNSPTVFAIRNDGTTTVNLGGASAVQIAGINSSDYEGP